MVTAFATIAQSAIHLHFVVTSICTAKVDPWLASALQLRRGQHRS
jgi:hypothetical protein